MAMHAVATTSFFNSNLISAHSNLKIFITHGGQLSTTETIHFGVPIIGIPVYGDQFVNMNLAVNNGFGIKIGLTEDLSEHMEVSIKEILSNPR